MYEERTQTAIALADSLGGDAEDVIMGLVQALSSSEKRAEEMTAQCLNAEAHNMHLHTRLVETTAERDHWKDAALGFQAALKETRAEYSALHIPRG